MNVHIGCGKRDFGKGWTHIDRQAYPHIDYVTDDVYNLPYEKNTVDIIYASHILEYFDYVQCKQVLAAWYDVIKTGGIIRLAVPNFDKIVWLYNKYHDIDKCIGMLYGKIGKEPDFIYHKCVFDRAKLEKMLIDGGFRNVKLWDWRKTDHSHIDDCSQAYFPHMQKDTGILMSLNLEAMK